jgi:hypothetical protein
VSMVGPPKTDCPRVREKVIWESLYPILGSIRPHGLEIDDIKERLKPLLVDYAIETPTFDPGAFVYRARRLGAALSKSKGIKLQDLIYPPSAIAPLGRLNRAGQPVFYCSMHKEAVFFEVQDLKMGDEIVLTYWKIKERAVVNNIGYTEFAFERLGAKRVLPQWGPPQAPDSTEGTMTLPILPKKVIDPALSHDRHRVLKEAFSEH